MMPKRTDETQNLFAVAVSSVFQIFFLLKEGIRLAIAKYFNCNE